MGIIGKPLKNMPWEDKPGDCQGVVWRYSGNPIIERNPAKNCARVYNSAVIPHGNGFAGVFRADHTDGKARLHFGRSSDAIHWEIEDNPSGGQMKKESRMIPIMHMIPGWLRSTAFII